MLQSKPVHESPMSKEKITATYDVDLLTSFTTDLPESALQTRLRRLDLLLTAKPGNAENAISKNSSVSLR